MAIDRKLTANRLRSASKWLGHSGPVVYFIGSMRGELVKIGYATDLANRMRHLQTGSPVKLEVLAAVIGGIGLEREYHRRFAEFREHGEWFRRTPEVRAEILRLQEPGPPAPSAEELTERAANIKAYWREQQRRLRGLI